MNNLGLFTSDFQRVRVFKRFINHLLEKKTYFPQFLLLTIVLSQFSCSFRTTTSPELLVAAAASLSPVFEEIDDLFSDHSGVSVNFSFAATGTLREQIVNGAPFDVFATANTSYLDDLIESGYIHPESRVLFACGKIAVVTHPLSSLSIRNLTDLTNPAVNKIALANPEIAPYGEAARQALISAQIWEAVKDRVVYAENVRQALQFVETGDIRYGILPSSLLIEKKLSVLSIPPSYYPPIEHAIGINVRSRQAKWAREFIDFLLSSQGQDVLARHHLQLEECMR